MKKSTLMGFWLLTVAFGNVFVALLAALGDLELADFFWFFSVAMGLAASLFGAHDPIGRVIPQDAGRDGTRPIDRRIVGVVEEFRQRGDFTPPGNYAFLRHNIAAAPPGAEIPSVMLIKTRPGTTAAFEERYRSVGEYVSRMLPRDAVVLSMQHSGSVPYYSGRQILRYNYLDPDDVRVQALCPGFTQTEFHDSELLSDRRSKLPKFLWLEAGYVVKQSLKSLERNEVICVPGRAYQFTVFMIKSGLADPLANRIAVRIRKRAA